MTTFTELIERKGVERNSARWENLRTEYQFHLKNPEKQWGFVWNASFGFHDGPPDGLPLGE